MKQISLATSGFELVTKRTRKRVFLDEMSLVVPWRQLVGLIQPFAPMGTGVKGGRPTFAVETMLRIHFLQQWFGLSDPAMEEALHDTPLYCEFARLDAGMARMPDETTILRFRHLLEEYNLSIQDRHGCGCHADCCAQLDQEQPWRAGPGDAPDQERQSVALRHEGAHWCRC